jgi:uncharacterized protein YggE
MQMVENPWGVTVHGAASVKAVPDLVRIGFKVTRLDPSPAKALAAASDAVTRVRGTLREHHVPDAAGVRLGPVIHVDDQDPERMELTRGHVGGGDGSGEDLAPGHVVVSAAVVLGFAIAHD